MNNINARIKARREQLGLTQDELARRLGYKGKSSINKIELGKACVPSKKIEDFALELDTTVSYLMGFEDSPEPLEIDPSRLYPLEPVGDEVEALNALLYDLGEHIIKVDGDYFLGECGTISEDDIAFIRSSALSGVGMALDVLKKRARKELRDAISGK